MVEWLRDKYGIAPEADETLGEGHLWFAAESGKLPLFRHCLGFGDLSDRALKEVRRKAASAPCCDLLRWLVETGRCELDLDLCYFAAKAGRLENLQYLREADCPWYALKVLRLAVEAR